MIRGGRGAQSIFGSFAAWCGVCWRARVRRPLVLAILLVAAHARADDTVRITALYGVLEHAESVSAHWDVICVAPCSVVVPRAGFYKLAGPRASDATAIPPDAIEVTLGSKSNDHYAGLLVGGIGVVSLLVGAVVLGFGVSDPSTGIWIAGTVVSGTGLLAAIIGFAVHYATIPF
jgi:hypothetical protein